MYVYSGAFWDKISREYVYKMYVPWNVFLKKTLPKYFNLFKNFILNVKNYPFMQ